MPSADGQKPTVLIKSEKGPARPPKEMSSKHGGTDRVAMMEQMSKGWHRGKPETLCGPGSTLKHSGYIRELLPQICEKYGVKTLVDAGAGDLNWIQHVELPGVEYLAYDLIPRHEDVKQADITLDVLPKADLILCRHVLNHLSSDLVHDALLRFQESGSKLLLMTNRKQQHAEFWGLLSDPIEEWKDRDYGKKWSYELREIL